MMGYEEEYHTLVHSSLFSRKYYYVKAKLALLKYFDGIPKESRILEFGCGLGQNIFLLPNAVGYDASKFALDFCRKKGIRATEEINDVRDSSIDAALLCHSLEHVKNPFETLIALRKKLKKDGKLILILPVERHKKADFRLDKNQHLYSWNFRTINNLLIKAGYKVIANKYLAGRGYRKLLFLSDTCFRLYYLLTTMIGLILSHREMKIIAVKE